MRKTLSALAVCAPRFEVFLALWSMLSPRAVRHRDWSRQTRAALSRETKGALHSLKDCAIAWPILADLVGPLSPDCSVEDMAAAMRRLQPQTFARQFLAHAIHDGDAAAKVVARSIGAKEAVEQAPIAKREWLTHIGLYPFDPASDVARLIARLVKDPASVRDAASAALLGFWRDAFGATWQAMAPSMNASRQKAEDILTTGDWGRLGHKLGLNAEFDLDKRELRALRGGYRLAFADIAELMFLPSAFNEQNFWTVLQGKRGAIAYFPFFDPGISPSAANPGEAMAPGDALEQGEPDIALAFRALGDATRFAMASLIARRAMSASEIGRQLGLSKPTVTHHLHQLRQAGLIEEKARGASLEISLSRGAVASLSRRALLSLFDSIDSGKFQRSRRIP